MQPSMTVLAENRLAHRLASVDRAAPPPARAAARDAAGLLLAEQDRLRRLVHRLLGWPGAGADVDDVVQDVLLMAWRHRTGFRGDSALATWLAAIAVRQVRRHLRWRRVRDRLAALVSPADLATESPSANETHDEVQAMQRALARLRSDDRAVLVLRYLEDRPIADVAAVLGCSRAAADQRLSRARQRLRAELDIAPDGGRP